MTSLLVEWVQSTDDPTLGGGVEGYEVACEPGPNPVAVVQWVPASPDEDDTYWIDEREAGTWFYRVRAVAVGRHSLWSNEAVITLRARARVTLGVLRRLGGVHRPPALSIGARPPRLSVGRRV